MTGHDGHDGHEAHDGAAPAATGRTGGAGDARPRLRPITAADLPALAVLNDAAVPAVNPLGEDGLRAHVPRCEVAVCADTRDAFVLALAPGTDYASENYRWFSEHRPGSLYVDRIVVDPAGHGRGTGRALYGVVVERARRLGLREITCEVNLEPPNPGSLAFHGRLGFVQVGEQVTKGGSVRVALLAMPVAAEG